MQVIVESGDVWLLLLLSVLLVGGWHFLRQNDTAKFGADNDNDSPATPRRKRARKKKRSSSALTDRGDLDLDLDSSLSLPVVSEEEAVGLLQDDELDSPRKAAISLYSVDKKMERYKQTRLSLAQIKANKMSSKVRLHWEENPRSVLVVKKWRDSEITECMQQLGDWLLERGLQVLVEPDVAEELRNFQSYEIGEGGDLSKRVDFVVCLGGDGTLLHATTLFPTAVPPCMSFSLGSLGFLTPFGFHLFPKHIQSVLDGDFFLTLRSRLTAAIVGTGDCKGERYGDPKTVMNEVVIDRGPTGYMTNLEVFCDDEFITNVQADGLIIATATGSTAYSLSAGGSIVHPSLPSILLTPICAHSISFRPIIFPDASRLKIRLSPDSRSDSAYVAYDGRNRTELRRSQAVEISMSKWPVPTINKTNETRDWFRSLANCLHWNKRVAQRPLKKKAGK